MKNFDVYGDPVSIHLKSRYIIKTEVGGCLTILAYLLLFGYFYASSKDIFFKKEPKLITENKISEKPIEFNLTSENFAIYFNLFDNDMKNV